MVWAVSLLTMALSCHRLTPVRYPAVFVVYLGLVDLFRPLAETEPYPRGLTHKDSPKAISRRTSYRQVR